LTLPARLDPARLSIRRHIVAGIAVVVVLFGGVGGWTATTELAGAVIAPGILVVENNVKKVQHLSGGVVSELRVSEGDRVKAGDVLVRLEGTQTRANLQIIKGSLDELAARKARLEAERDGAERVTFPGELIARADDPELMRVLSGEQKLFELRLISRNGQKEQLSERITQLREEVEGLMAQSAAKEREIALITKELISTQELYRKQLVTLARLTELERTAARLDGEYGQVIAAIAQAKGKMAEIELQIIQIDQELRSEVGGQLADLRAKIFELMERKAAAQDQMNRLDIKAPQAGTVHQLAIHTIGGVVHAGEPLMLIIPSAAALAVEARIAPQEIDRLYPGQNVALRFSSFNQRTTPEIEGRLGRVAADVSQDQRTGLSYYTVRIDISNDELKKLGAVKLLPGMPVESFIATEQRTVISYLTKPLSDQLLRAFRQR
jgi:membrane fusion protein, type I secretion system